MAEALGWPLMPWQRMVADVANEVDPATGLFAYSAVGLTVPRQSGKTTLTGANMEHRTIYRPRRRVWYTTKSREDTRDWLLNEHVPGLQSSPLEPYAKIRKAQGSEGIAYPHGGLLRIFAPMRSALHSKQSDLVIVDEAWAPDLERGHDLDQGIVPTQATRPGAQVWKVSTAGDENSLWLWETVTKGRAFVDEGRTDGVAYFEWSCPDDLDPCASSSWEHYHPAYAITIGAPQMKAALEELGPAAFARAYGNRWPEGMGKAAAPKIPTRPVGRRPSATYPRGAGRCPGRPSASTPRATARAGPWRWPGGIFKAYGTRSPTPGRGRVDGGTASGARREVSAGGDRI